MKNEDLMRTSYIEDQPEFGLFFLRLTGSLILFFVHGLPKLTHFNTELVQIDDPLHLGRGLTLCLALFAEIICPLLIATGIFTRLACMPIIFLLLISMFVVHPEWTIAQGQFGWLLLIIFTTIALSGPGAFSIDKRYKKYDQ